MAGLCGVIALTGGVDVIALNRSLSSGLRHRGPDGLHEWSGPGAAIAHLALRVRPGAPVVAQPLRMPDGRICVVDGFVGNPDSLMRALDCEAGTSLPEDSQLIALALERWGTDFWRHVEGDFAVALWEPIGRRLLLVRDRLGVRPMFHVRTPQLIAFSSEPEPLFRLPGVEGRVRDTSVVEVWTQLAFTQGGWSDTQGVVACLPAAHHLGIDAQGKTALERYWRLEPRPSLVLRDESEYVQAFQDVFGNAVASAARGAGTSALMLSGGIDSGAILAAARGFKPGVPAGGLVCISAVTDDATPGEGYRAETANIKALTAIEPRVTQFTVPVQAHTGEVIEAADAAQVAWSHLHPIDASVYIPSLVCRVARQQGCRVVLNGAGGDVVTSSSRNYPGRLVLDGHWRDAAREAAAAAHVHTYLRGQSPARILAKSLLSELQPRVVRRMRARRALGANLKRLRSSELSPDFLSSAGIEAQITAGLPKRLGKLDSDPDALRCETMSECLADSSWGLDRIGSRQGMEARDPWVDLKVVEFFLALPLQWRVQRGWTKFLVRRACEDALGPEVVWHSGKRHHGPLVTRQVVIDAAPYLLDYLRSVRPMLDLYFRASFLDRIDHGLTDPGGLDHAQANQVNALVALTGWIQRQGPNLSDSRS